MTRERLAQLSDNDVEHLAEIFDLDTGEDDSRGEIEQALFEAMEEARAEQDQTDSFPVAYHQRRFESVEDLFGSSDRLTEDDFVFPESYNVTRIEIILRDPAWAYVYWDISIPDRTLIYKNDKFQWFFLRLEEIAPTKPADQLYGMDIPVQISDNAWYVNLLNRETQYQIHLFAQYEGTETCLATSKVVGVPRGGLSAKLEIIDSFETDALIALSGIEHLGVGEMVAEIPQRIVSFKERQGE